MVTKKEAAAKIDEVEHWYFSKKRWVQVAGLIAFGIFLGRIGAPWLI